MEPSIETDLIAELHALNEQLLELIAEGDADALARSHGLGFYATGHYS